MSQQQDLTIVVAFRLRPLNRRSLNIFAISSSVVLAAKPFRIAEALGKTMLSLLALVLSLLFPFDWDSETDRFLRDFDLSERRDEDEEEEDMRSLSSSVSLSLSLFLSLPL